jgi:hypothetical protein
MIIKFHESFQDKSELTKTKVQIAHSSYQILHQIALPFILCPQQKIDKRQGSM